MNGLATTPEGVAISLRVVPGASRNEIKIEDDGTLKVRLQAPALEGKANKALLKFLAKQLNLPPRSLSLLSGDKARNKRILVKSGSLAEIAALLVR